MGDQEDRISNLIRDVLFQVFLRLPPRSLCACRSVSKQWRDLILDPSFLNLHSHQSKKNPLMIVVDDEVGLLSDTFKITFINPLTTSPTESFSISVTLDAYRIAYCSGFLMFCGNNGNIILCNPSTKELVKLNHDLFVRIKSRSPDPSNSDVFPQDYYTGFGYLPSKSQYKIVKIFIIKIINEDERNFSSEVQALVMTLRCGSNEKSWKVVPVKIFDFQKTYPRGVCKSICVNGTIYWLVWQESHNPNARRSLKIIYFDLETEEFEKMKCPLRYSAYYDYFFLVELKGKLCLVDMLPGKPVLDIWALEDKKNGIWAKVYTINYSSLDGFDHQKLPNTDEMLAEEVPQHVIPLQVVVNNNCEETMLIMLSDIGSFNSYNLKTKTFTKLATYAKDLSGVLLHNISLLPLPSLASLKIIPS